jgi:hypothetical protein
MSAVWISANEYRGIGCETSASKSSDLLSTGCGTVIFDLFGFSGIVFIRQVAVGKLIDLNHYLEVATDVCFQCICGTLVLNDSLTGARFHGWRIRGQMRGQASQVRLRSADGVLVRFTVSGCWPVVRVHTMWEDLCLDFKSKRLAGFIGTQSGQPA